MYLKTLFFLAIFILFSFHSFGQSSERPEGIVLPVATLGDVSETRRQILQNTLIESLSSYYRLVPQDKLEEVQEKIFQEMDYDECTEDQCIMMIQEALQVENLFVLQVIGEDDDTQLSLKWVGLDDKKVKTDYCEDCGTKELNDRVEGLVKILTVSEEIISTPTVEKEEPEEGIYQDKIKNNKFGNNQLTVFFYLSNQSLGTVIGIGSVDVKKHSNSSIGISVNNFGYFLNQIKIDFLQRGGDDYPYPYNSTTVNNYELSANFFSFTYKWNYIILGYNHLISGNVFVDRHYTSQQRTPPYEPFYSYRKNESQLEVYGGGGVILGFLYSLEDLIIGIKYDRYSLRAKNDLEITGNLFQLQSYSLGLGYSF